MITEMETKKPNWFVRILVILLSIFIGGLIFFNFFWFYPPTNISAGMLVLVAILTVLVLSEAFDNFSINKLITLSRTVKEKEANNNELKKENTELRNQIITISTNINQKQVNTTYLLTDELAKMLTVKKAEEPEKEQKKEEAEEDEETTQTVRKFVSFSKLEEIALSNFLKTEGLHQLPLIRDAKFFIHFHQIDPISEYSPIFDGYIKTLDTEIFIEMKPIGRINPSYIRDRVYLMLSKINYYRTIKKINAYLFLVFVAIPDDEKNKSMIERIYKEFEPAISNGLLKVRTVNISQQEYNSINETE